MQRRTAFQPQAEAEAEVLPSSILVGFTFCAFIICVAWVWLPHGETHARCSRQVRESCGQHKLALLLCTVAWCKM